MVNYKNNLLEEVSQEINSNLKDLYDKNYLLDEEIDDTSQIELKLKRISQLEEIREIVLQYPEWPYNGRNIKKFAGLTISPIVTFSIPI